MVFRFKGFKPPTDDLCHLGKEDVKENGHYFLSFEDVLDMA